MKQSKERPFISIIMTCYNYGQWLSRPLDAIIRQTFRDFEFIFVDNGCTDNSMEIAEEFGRRHPEISMKIVSVEKNIGIAHGQNVGAGAASGKYLMFHDADDWMDDNTLELLAAAAKENDADRVIACFRDVNDKGETIQIQQIAEKPVFWLYTMLQANLFRGEIYRKESIRIPNNVFWNDVYLTVCFSKYVKKAAYVTEPCYNYLVHTDSFSRSKELHKLIWDNKYSLVSLLKACWEVYNSVPCEDRLWMEYTMVMVYYSYIFQFLRDAPLKEKWKNYTKLRDVMRSYFPDYLHNPKLSLKWKGGKRRYARIVVRLSAMLERRHLMKLGLFGYHLLSKVRYFKV